jgi:hypothetical protein
VSQPAAGRYRAAAVPARVAPRPNGGAVLDGRLAAAIKPGHLRVNRRRRMRSDAGEPRDLVLETFREYTDGVPTHDLDGAARRSPGHRPPLLLRPRARARDAVTAAMLLIDLTALALVTAGVGGAVRFLIGMVVALAVPGWAVVSHLDLRWPAAEVALSTAGSLAAVLLVAQLTVMTRAWQPTAATWIVGGASAVLLVARMVRSRRHPAPVEP